MSPSKEHDAPESHHPVPEHSAAHYLKSDIISLPSSIDEDSDEKQFGCNCSRYDPGNKSLFACDTMLKWVRLTSKTPLTEKSDYDALY
jgi:hypothetical protein